MRNDDVERLLVSVRPIAEKVSARKLYLEYPTYQSRLYLKYLGPRVQDSSNYRKVL